MPRRRPIPAARRQFPQRQGMPIQARMQRNPGQMARQARTQARNPRAGRAGMWPTARDARRQMSLSGEMRERASARPAGPTANWQGSIWFQIPFLGGFVDLLRNLVYPQEHLRIMENAFVGTGIGSIATNRARARLGQRRLKNIARQQALVQRNRLPRTRSAIAGRQVRKRTRDTRIYPGQKAA